MVVVEPIPCLMDNYAYLVRLGDEAWVVDPADGVAVSRAVEARPEVTLRGVLATHHHPDHVGGIETLLRLHGELAVAGHATDKGRIRGQNVFVDAAEGRFEATELALGDLRWEAMHVPGHTRGGIAWRLTPADGGPAHVFTGDTLFAGGCGRLFEGTAEQMYRSLTALTEQRDGTHLWFGHEYTEGNLRFAVTVEPDNAALRARLDELPDETTPTTVGEERATNPFVRAGSVAEFATRRAAKDRA